MAGRLVVGTSDYQERGRHGRRAPRGQRQQQFLAAVKKNPGARGSEIAKEMGVPPSQAYALARRLQQNGQIRKAGPGLRRSVAGAPGLRRPVEGEPLIAPTTGHAPAITDPRVGAFGYLACVASRSEVRRLPSVDGPDLLGAREDVVAG